MTAGEDREPVVKITLRTIYDEVTATRRIVEPLQPQVVDHEARIRLLEAFKERMSGSRSTVDRIIAAVGGGVVATLGQHLVK